MSGHSHFSSIKHKKAITDAKRSNIFSKIAREITLAAKDGGDPDANSKLRAVMDKAKGVNMPSDNVTRAIKRGTGEEKGQILEEILVEAYGPGGIAILIEGITDNKNRSLGEIRLILGKHGGKPVDGGAIQWLFERKGIVTATTSLSKDEAELAAIDAGAEDVEWDEEIIELQTNPTSLEQLRKSAEEKEFTIESSFLGWVPKEPIEIDEKAQEKIETLFEALDDQDDVQNIYSNIK